MDISTREVPDDWLERWKRFHQPVLIEGPVAELRDGGDRGLDRSSAEEPSPIGVEDVGVCGQHASRALGGLDGGDLHGRPPSLHVRPPWEAPSDRPDVLEIVIDPAQAFGTGAHATTRLCLEMLLDLVASGDSRGAVLDIGAGSGVLAIAAARLGYGPVLALDNDRESVSAIVSNAAVNGVELEARRFDLRREALPWLDGGGDGDGVPGVLPGPVRSELLKRRAGETVVLANLLRPLLLGLADSMGAAPRHLIAGGLLCEQADEVAEAFATRLGLCEQARRERGEWAALWLTLARWPRAPSP